MKRIKLLPLFIFIFFAISIPAHAVYRSFELHASSVETITGADTAGVVHRDGGDIRCYLDITAAGTGDTIDIDLIGVVRGSRFVIASFTQASGISTESILFTEAPNLLSLDWTIAGDGGETFTFSVVCASS
jgi:hypothetical protein